MNIFGNCGIEIELKNDEDFLKIRETLTRIGIPTFDLNKTSPKSKGLIQSVHILHKKGKYAIVHFKELFILDGKNTFYKIDEFGNKVLKETFISNDDIERRNAIAFLLEDWGLLKIKEPDKFSKKGSISKIKIISHKEKNDWELITKHSLGKKKN